MIAFYPINEGLLSIRFWSNQPHRRKKSGLSSEYKGAASVAFRSGAFPSHVRRYAEFTEDHVGLDFQICRQTLSTSTRSGCSSTLAIDKTSYCFCSATSKV